MTKEEAINHLTDMYKYSGLVGLDREDRIALSKGIEALEQEPILDKIRAEIEQNAYPIVHGVNNHEKGMTLYGILQVIDKYKAESEEKK